MDATGSSVANLTDTPTIRDLAPAWSPDGQHLAYTRITREGGKPDLYVMNANGSARERLTSTTVPERDPAWSPDGTRLAFSAFGNASSDIFVMDLDGSNRINLTNHPDVEELPAWAR